VINLSYGLTVDADWRSLRMSYAVEQHASRASS
jgi:hypothetical protein